MTDYGPSDTSTTTLGPNQFPISEVYVPNGSLTALEGGPVSTDGANKKSAPVSIYAKDGGDVAQGLTTDAAVTGDNPGTLSAKIRGFVKILTDVWDSVNHRIKVDGSGVTQPVGAKYTEISAGPATGLNTYLLAATDVSAYSSFSFQFPPQTNTLGVTFQHSDDGVNWTPLHVQHSTGAGGTSFFNPSNIIVSGVIDFRYLAIQITSFTSGNVSGLLHLVTLPVTQLVLTTSIQDSNGNALLGNQGDTNAIFGTFTTTQTTGDIINTSARGVILFVNMISAGTGSVTLHIQGKDAPSGLYYDILVASTPITANGTYAYMVYPGLGSNNALTQAASAFLPRDWRIQMVANNANSMQYAVNYGTEM